MSVKNTYYTFMNLTLLSTFFICSAYMQNFKNIMSDNMPYDSPWVDYALSILEIESFVLMCLILSVLYPISSF